MAIGDIFGKVVGSVINTHNNYSPVGPERTPAQKAHRYILDSKAHILKDYAPLKDLPGDIESSHKMINDLTDSHLEHYATAMEHLNNLNNWAHKRDIKVEMGKSAVNAAIAASIGGASLAVTNLLLNKIGDIASNQAKKLGWSKEKEEEVTKTASDLVIGVFNRHHDECMRDLCTNSEKIYLGKNTVS